MTIPQQAPPPNDSEDDASRPVTRQSSPSVPPSPSDQEQKEARVDLPVTRLSDSGCDSSHAAFLAGSVTRPFSPSKPAHATSRAGPATRTSSPSAIPAATPPHCDYETDGLISFVHVVRGESDVSAASTKAGGGSPIASSGMPSARGKMSESDDSAARIRPDCPTMDDVAALRLWNAELIAKNEALEDELRVLREANKTLKPSEDARNELSQQPAGRADCAQAAVRRVVRRGDILEQLHLEVRLREMRRRLRRKKLQSSMD